jgi:glycosyltransferase involved in cell wall biosynthesis
VKVLFIDHSTCLNSLNDLREHGRGGMVSSLVILPDVLSQLNIECAVLSDIKARDQRSEKGVVWYHRDEFEAVAGQSWDVIVFNRTTHDGLPELKAKGRILWTHDCPHGGWIPDPGTIKAFSATVFMSRYSETVWRYYYPTIGKSFFIPNGVDKSIFYPREKDLETMIFTSAPNRGLVRLSLFHEALKNKVNPKLRMLAFSDMKTMHPAEGDLEGTEDLYSAHYLPIAESGVELMGCRPQEEMAEYMGRAGLMLIPSGYPEQCSNSVLQALASGTPVITTGGLGATPEWVKHGYNGMLTRFHLEDYMAYHMNFTRIAMEILKNEKLHRKLIKNAPKTKGLFTWEEIGRKWVKMFHSAI